MSKTPDFVDAMKVTVLMDDSAGYDNPYLAQHGLALFAEIFRGNKKTCILLDTGQKAEPLLHNMKLTGISPRDIDVIFLSHCHYDHTGGLEGILAEMDREVPIVAHPLLFRETFSLNPVIKPIGLGLTREKLLALGGRPTLVKEPFSLLPGVISSGEIKRTSAFEGKGIGTYNLEEGRLTPDPISDDLSLYINLKNRGLFVLTGCSHAGIINILQHGTEVTGVPKVCGLMGGLHLLKASGEDVDRTAAEMARYEPDHIWAGHCTGLAALGKLAQAFPRSFNQLQVGRQLHLQ